MFYKSNDVPSYVQDTIRACGREYMLPEQLTLPLRQLDKIHQA